MPHWLRLSQISHTTTTTTCVAQTHVLVLRCCWWWQDLPLCFCRTFAPVSSCSWMRTQSRNYRWKMTIFVDLGKRKQLNINKNDVTDLVNLKCHNLIFWLYLQRWSKCSSRSCTAVSGLSQWFPWLKMKNTFTLIHLLIAYLFFNQLVGCRCECYLIH